MEMNKEGTRSVTEEIVDYVEREIIPRYAAFDKAHRENHVRMVIEQSMKLAEHTPSMNADMVYVIAAFHDLGLVNGRENHHRDSRLILEADEFVRAHFTADQIRVMGEAVEDHRASNSQKPRSEYGLTVVGRSFHRAGDDNPSHHTIWAGALSRA